ncbi:hypothetical protein [Streptomyces abikoensis]
MPERPSDSDTAMAVRDFFAPAELLEFVDLADPQAQEQWGRDALAARGGRHSVRRLEFEPDPGSTATWTPWPHGFRYEVTGSGKSRSHNLTWREVASYIHERLTPQRYGRLNAAVEALLAHERAYLPSFIPYRSAQEWNTSFAAPWSRRQSELELSAACAKDAILPAAQDHPTLF